MVGEGEGGELELVNKMKRNFLIKNMKKENIFVHNFFLICRRYCFTRSYMAFKNHSFITNLYHANVGHST